jgi:DUF1009 family protein
MQQKVGIVAGAGLLPLMAASALESQNKEFKIYAVKESLFLTQPEADRFSSKTEIISIARFGSFLKSLQKNNITKLLLLGKVEKINLFKNFNFDFKTLIILKSLINKNDDSLFKAMLREFEKLKIEVLRQDAYLKELYLTEGISTKKKPSKPDLEDITYGLEYAKKMGGLDVGQTVIVRNKSILAVEAIEGTDECIKRGGQLSNGKGAIVCKVEKTKQDKRFDVPTVGLNTLETMHRYGCHVLALEAGKVFVVSPSDVIARANQLKIAIVSVKL